MKYSIPFHRDRRGAALVEYGLLVGLVAAAAIGAVQGLGDRVNTAFTEVHTELSVNLAGVGADGGAGAGPGGSIETSGPTGAAASSFSMTPQPHPSANYLVGYRSSGGMGTLHSYEGPFDEFMRLDIDRNNSRVSVEIRGNFAAALSGHRMTCDDGLDLGFDEATVAYLDSSTNTTTATWYSVAGTTGWLVAGNRINCEIST